MGRDIRAPQGDPEPCGTERGRNVLGLSQEARDEIFPKWYGESA